MPDFSKDQLIAINHNTGPALVIAGPGSGKTHILVNRIYNLIRTHNIEPENILVITFSKYAAVEMQQRFNNLCGDTIYPVNFGTFHSVFFHIISDAYKYNSRSIASMPEIRIILKNILKHFININNQENEFIDSLYKRISYYKNSGFKRDDDSLCEMNRELFFKVFLQYQDAMSSLMKIDFDDMVLKCKELLETNMDLCKKYRNKFKYILVDEYQDINILQYEVLKLLLSDEQNLFAVGDDDQSIYGFRGSNPKIMSNFKNDFKNAKIIKMTCCYRCSKNIVEASKTVIEDNIERYEKNIHTTNEDEGEVYIKEYSNKDDEYEHIIDDLSKNVFYKDTNCAVLFRTNILASDFVELLLKRKIPCVVKEKINNPYNTQIFRDFCHYLKMAGSYNMDISDVVAVINKPCRYVNSYVFTGDKINILELRNIYKQKNYMQAIISKLEKDLEWLNGMDMYSAFNYFRKVIGYEEYLKKEYADNEIKLKNNITLLEDMQKRLAEFNSYEELIKHVQCIETKIKGSPKIKIKDNGIYVMTYHGSKGLEFGTVYLPDINEGEVPNKRCKSNEQIEEERRMFYVAMTRAKKKLIISYTGKKDEGKAYASRFIKRLTTID